MNITTKIYGEQAGRLRLFSEVKMDFPHIDDVRHYLLQCHRDEPCLFPVLYITRTDRSPHTYGLPITPEKQ